MATLLGRGFRHKPLWSRKAGSRPHGDTALSRPSDCTGPHSSLWKEPFSSSFHKRGDCGSAGWSYLPSSHGPDVAPAGMVSRPVWPWRGDGPPTPGRLLRWVGAEDKGQRHGPWPARSARPDRRVVTWMPSTSADRVSHITCETPERNQTGALCSKKPQGKTRPPSTASARGADSLSSPSGRRWAAHHLASRLLSQTDSSACRKVLFLF